MSECEHDWIPYELEPRHMVGTNVAGQAYVSMGRVVAMYVSRVKCVKCGEEKDIETPKGDFERQMELEARSGSE